MNIRDALIREFDFKKKTDETFDRLPVYEREKTWLVTVQTEPVYAEHLNNLRTDLVVFASRHESVSGRACLTVHTPGNWMEAQHGGRTGDICISPAFRQTVALRELHQQVVGLGIQDRFSVSLEATHHGPLLKSTPCFFIEIGSTIREWKDPVAASIVAKSLLRSIEEGNVPKGEVAFGVGGSHYPKSFTEIGIKTDVAFGHIAPKYVLPHLDENMLRKGIDRVLERVSFVMVEWKGLGKYRQAILSALDRIGIGWIKTRDVNA